MTREKLMEYIIEKLRYADTEVLTVIYTLLLYRVPSGSVPAGKGSDESEK